MFAIQPSFDQLKDALKQEDSLFSTYFYRRISLRITYLLIRTQITPNQITFFSLILGLVASFLFSLGSYYYALVGILFIHLSFLFDHVDGEIARYKKLRSDFGAWFDQVSDRIKESTAFIGLALGIYLATGSSLPLILGMFAVFNLFMIGHLRGTTSQLKFEHTSELKITSKVHIGSVDTTIFLITLAVIFDLQLYLLMLYATFGCLAWFYQIYTRYKRSTKTSRS
ncbi:MAG TPA: CDP-alcohol phosphatidyltransferase family protein [Candidatus Nanoarchaeia archaeon]|nr:CDP-alcohol phosphatidyltransferase family protein [Candidatus Nanoarchaeia archaeon]